MITTITSAAAFVLPATVAVGMAAAAVVAFATRPQAVRAAVRSNSMHSADLSVKRTGWDIDQAYGTAGRTSFDPPSRGTSG